MDSVSALDFARLARSLAEEARAAGWVVPAFRSPPGLAGATRTVRRQHGAGVVVAVRRAGRTREQVTADLIEGIIVANEWSGAMAATARLRLSIAPVAPMERAA